MANSQNAFAVLMSINGNLLFISMEQTSADIFYKHEPQKNF